MDPSLRLRGGGSWGEGGESKLKCPEKITLNHELIQQNCTPEANAATHLADMFLVGCTDCGTADPARRVVVSVYPQSPPTV